MSETELDFLEVPAETTDAAPAEEAAPQPEAPQPEAAPAEESPSQEAVAKAVPLTALLDERERRQEAERKARELEQQLQASRKPVEQVAPPDPLVDYEGYTRFNLDQASLQATNVKFEMREDLAREKYGDQVVNEAQAWAQNQMAEDPGFFQKLIGQRNPYRWVVEQFQRDVAIRDLNLSEIEQFRAWKAAQAGQAQPQTAASAAPTTAQVAAAPPKSIVNAPPAGGAPKPGQMPLGDDAVFQSLF